jgi:hypothetical protein
MKIKLMKTCNSCHDGPWWNRPMTNIVATYPECAECDYTLNKWKARKVLSLKEAIKILKAKGGKDDSIEFLKRRGKWKKAIKGSWKWKKLI